MARLVRLPPTVGSDEVRVFWQSEPGEFSSLGVEGPRGIYHMALSHFGHKRQEFVGSLVDSLEARMDGKLVDKPSFLDELVAEGFDPTTLVFSIRKKGLPAPTDVVPVDPRKLIEDAQQESLDLEADLDGLDTVKDLTVADYGDMDNLKERISRIQKGLAAALAMLVREDV
jgi:hypothetical protein